MKTPQIKCSLRKKMSKLSPLTPHLFLWCKFRDEWWWVPPKPYRLPHMLVCPHLFSVHTGMCSKSNDISSRHFVSEFTGTGCIWSHSDLELRSPTAEGPGGTLTLFIIASMCLPVVWVVAANQPWAAALSFSMSLLGRFGVLLRRERWYWMLCGKMWPKQPSSVDSLYLILHP